MAANGEYEKLSARNARRVTFPAARRALISGWKNLSYTFILNDTTVNFGDVVYHDLTDVLTRFPRHLLCQPPPCKGSKKGWKMDRESRFWVDRSKRGSKSVPMPSKTSINKSYKHYDTPPLKTTPISCKVGGWSSKGFRRLIQPSWADEGHSNVWNDEEALNKASPNVSWKYRRRNPFACPK